MNTAIVSLAIGEPHLAYWQRHCERSWRRYAARHGYDLIVLTELIDQSESAVVRSPAWQKCLVLNQDFAAKYERIVLELGDKTSGRTSISGSR